jgi:hypothetical protein
LATIWTIKWDEEVGEMKTLVTPSVKWSAMYLDTAVSSARL